MIELIKLREHGGYMGILKRKIKKYNKYVIEIENEDIEANNFENVEDVIIISKKDFENELNKSKELSAKLHSRDLELKLKELKLQEKDIEIQKATSKMEELEETYNSQLNVLEKKYLIESNELKQLLENSELSAQQLKKEHATESNELKQLLENSKISAQKLENDYQEIKEQLGNKINSLQNKIEEEEKLQNQMEVYRIGNIGLKNEIRNKEEEIDKLKQKHDKILDLKSMQEKTIENLRSDVNKLERVQIEHNKLINNYRHLQEVANKKDRTIIELEAKKRKLEQYLSMSLEAITTLKNLGLFNRLFNRVPEGIDELQEDIKKLQPPVEVEIEPVRVKKTSDILGEKN